MCTWQNEAAALPSTAAVSDIACRGSRWMATLCEEREPIGTTEVEKKQQTNKKDEIKMEGKTTGGGIQVRNAMACKLEFELALFLRPQAS